VTQHHRTKIRSSNKVSMAPMAITSAGEVLVNAHQFTTTDDLEAAVEAARATGQPIFIGVVVPSKLTRGVMKDIDNATADVAGRLAPKLISAKT
jgi:hypothetical protein